MSHGGSSSALTTSSNHILYPESISFSEEKRKSESLHRCLAALIVLLVCVAAVFLSLFLIYYFKQQDRDALDTCDTLSCVTAAYSVAEKMDASVDPCDDFAQYACGNFYKTATYKEGRTSADIFTVVRDSNDEIIKAILTEASENDQWNYTKYMKNHYAACMDIETAEEIGLQPYLNTSFAVEWPTLQGEIWSGEATFDFDDVMEQHELVYIETFFQYYINEDPFNSSAYMLSLFDPNLGLSVEYLVRPRNDSVLLAYEKYLADLAVELGADPVIAQRDAAEVVDLECALAKIVVPFEERRNYSTMINPTTLSELRETYTYMDIPRALRAAFSTVNITLEDDQLVNVGFPSYFEQLGQVIAGTSKRALQNMFSFTYAFVKTDELTKRLREIELEFEKVIIGRTEDLPRWEVCVADTSNVFSFAVSKEYVNRTFSEESKAYMDVMIDRVMESFSTVLDESSWMDESTRSKAHEKLDAMGRKVGYPDIGFRHVDLEKRYKELPMTADNFYSNRELYDTYRNKKYLLKLMTPVNKKGWTESPFQVNAFYADTKNEIVFPAGILQPPYFSDQFTDSMNYAAIGGLIGHEITHGFDDEGRQIDKDGHLVNWWSPDAVTHFQSKSQCMVDQYGGYLVEPPGMYLNGITTQGENIADNGGLKSSYMAYRKLVSEKGEAKRLPGLGLSHDQLFFLARSQIWCEKMSTGRIIEQIETDVHATGRYRIIGALQNSKEFADAFNCPKGSPMNPEKKCSVW